MQDLQCSDVIEEDWNFFLAGNFYVLRDTLYVLARHLVSSYERVSHTGNRQQTKATNYAIL